jgi:predicted nuclease with TOPRIM domain
MGIITDILKEIPVSAVLRDKLQELEKKYEELEVENTQLKGENQKLKSKVKELTSSDELCEDEVKILKLLSSGQKLPANMIAHILSLSLTKTEYYLGKMYDQYVSAGHFVGMHSQYSLIQKGREYLVENDLVE